MENYNPSGGRGSIRGIFANGKGSCVQVSEDYVQGFVWLLLASVTAGTFTLPMKFVRHWGWEHLWLVYSLISLLIFPVVIALLTIPQLWQVYQACSLNLILLAALFGVGWGAGSIFFGLGVDALGVALGYSMMLGIMAALGALVPLAVLTPDLMWTQSGLLILGGNVATTLGVVVCAVAGNLRDKQLGQNFAGGTLNPKISFSKALAICILGGVFSALMNFGYAFGKPIAETALHFGASKDSGLNAMWLIVIPAGGVLNIGYCMHMVQRGKSWHLMWSRSSIPAWFHACTMASLWTISLVTYGWGANRLGRLGPSLGWSLWMTALIITTFTGGLLSREWRGVTGRPLRLLWVAIFILFLATVLLGLGGAAE